MIYCFHIMADHGKKFKLYRWIINIWTNPRGWRCSMMSFFEKNKNFENRPKNRPKFWKKWKKLIFEEFCPVFWPVFKIFIFFKRTHHNASLPMMVCQYFDFSWSSCSFFIKYEKSFSYEERNSIGFLKFFTLHSENSFYKLK